MGRAKREIHEVPMLERFEHDRFRLRYEYDGVSGKVLKWSFNSRESDGFHHWYEYDARGYLLSVWTSRDSIEWVNDSRLYYYPTGWLRRRELGVDMFLQGLDYAYTSEGWLKAINSEVLSNDPGRDGTLGVHEHFASDVFSLLLRYYPKDYRPVNPTVPSLEATINLGTGWLYKPYYTGWISSWSLTLDTLHTAYSFTYDQLGQLRHARTLTGFSGTDWNATTTKAFSTSYTYDPVGNIRTLKRYDKDGNLLDDLTYHYYDTLRNNRLEYITDAVSSFTYDLGTQSPGNYQYDSVGNMISDASRTLTVQYTYSNRPKFINFASGRSLKMRYNPFGYRFFSGASNQDGDIFLYSSQGQLVAKYRVSGDVLKLNYLPIYEGSKRIGIVEPEDVSWLDCPELMPCDVVAVDPCMIGVIGQPMPMPLAPCKKDSSLKADRKYELVDHLGNVRVVIANQRMPIDMNGDSLVDYYKPLVKEISDYYPYGWVKFYGNYEFGANAGSLFEDWDSTRGTYYTLYRLLDSRIARWYQVEPKIDQYGTWSGYVVNMGNPVVAVDPFGRDTVWISQSNGKMQKHVEAKGKDVFIIVNDSTQEEVARLELPENSLEKVKRKEGIFVDVRKNRVTNTYDTVGISDFIDIYQIRGDTNAEKLFKFLADNVPVEWGWWQTGAPKIGELNFITTTGLKAMEKGGSLLFAKMLAYGYTLRMHVHSHPKVGRVMYWVPSKSDIKFKDWVEENMHMMDIYYNQFRKKNKVWRNLPKFKIYVPGEGEIEY